MSSLATFHIQSAEPASTSAKLNISMYDPFNYYAIGELWLYEYQSSADGQAVTNAAAVKELEEAGSLEVKRMSASPSDDSVLFTGLAANKQYSVILGCYDSSGEFVQKDYTTFSTAAVNNWLTIAGISWYNVSVTAHIDAASQELPQEVYGIVVTADSPESVNLNDYLSLAQIQAAEGTDLSAYISGMQSADGYTCSIATSALIGEDGSDDESKQYACVALIGNYSGSWQVIASQTTRNPYYGMSVEQTPEGDESVIVPANPADGN